MAGRIVFALVLFVVVSALLFGLYQIESPSAASSSFDGNVFSVTTPTPTLSGEPDPLGTQAAARATADVARAQEQAANNVVAAANQATQEAEQAIARETAVAIEVTNAAMLAAEETRRAEIAATSVAIEEMIVATTLEASKAQATSTAQAQATSTAQANAQATSTAQAQVVETLVARTATAEYVAPTQTIVAANTNSHLNQQSWSDKTVPWITVGKATFWAALSLLFILACAWVFPRAWIALQTRFLRVNNEADGLSWLFVGYKGLLGAWASEPQVTPYQADRDRGPGQTISPTRPEGLLPGSDPGVTRRAQGVQALTRPVLAATRHAAQRRVPSRGYNASRGARSMMPLGAGTRGYHILSPTAHRAQLPRQVQSQMDDIVLTQLDRDWRSR